MSNASSDFELEYDERNEYHATRHGLTPVIATQLLSGQPRFFLNREYMTGSHMIVGPDESGCLWTMIALEMGDNVWRPITGWASSAAQIDLYRREPV